MGYSSTGQILDILDECVRQLDGPLDSNEIIEMLWEPIRFIPSTSETNLEHVASMLEGRKILEIGVIRWQTVRREVYRDHIS